MRKSPRIRRPVFGHFEPPAPPEHPLRVRIRSHGSTSLVDNVPATPSAAVGLATLFCFACPTQNETQTETSSLAGQDDGLGGWILRTNDAARNECQRRAFDGRCYVLTNALEMLEAFLHDVVGDPLNRHRREMLGSRLSPRSFAPRAMVDPRRRSITEKMQACLRVGWPRWPCDTGVRFSSKGSVTLKVRLRSKVLDVGLDDELRVLASVAMPVGRDVTMLGTAATSVVRDAAASRASAQSSSPQGERCIETRQAEFSLLS